MLDLQIQIRRFPKPVIAMVAGYAIGGGHVLHLCCDLTIAADNARFGQTGPRVGSFDGGYGIGLLARQIGEKRAKEVWLLCRQYDAATALEWGLVNAVVAAGCARGHHRRMGARAPREVPAGAAAVEGRLQRRRRRPGRRPAAGRGRHAPLLHVGGGAGGPRRVPAAARPRLLALPETAMTRHRHVVARRAAPHAGRRADPGRGGHGGRGACRVVALRCGAHRRRGAADRRQPRQRRVRRDEGRRHGRAGGTAATHADRCRHRRGPCWPPRASRSGSLPSRGSRSRSRRRRC